MSNYKIIAHRGASADAPENTLAAIELAWKQGADGVEVDTRITKDGHLIVIHDGNTKRTGQKNPKPLIVKKSTLAELQKLNIGNEKYPNQRIPLLSEVIDSLPRGKELFIEIKSRDKRVISALLKILKNPDHITIISFSLPQLAALKKQAPHLKTYWLLGEQIAEAFIKKSLLSWASQIVKRAQKNNMNGLDFCGSFKSKNQKKLAKIYRELTQQALRAPLELAVWTVDDPYRAATLARLGVQAITTNCPGKLAKIKNN